MSVSGPDDRLLQRLAEALSVPVEEPEESEIGRLRATVARVRRLILSGADPAYPAPPGLESGRGNSGPGAALPDRPALSPLIFHPPPDQWPLMESP